MMSKGKPSGWSPYVETYDPLKAGSIDGTDVIPHDSAIVRALSANYKPPDHGRISSDPKLTLFVGRLNFRTSEQQLDKQFSQYGPLRSCHLVRDIATGISRGYGFVEFKKEADAQSAWRLAHSSVFHERQIVVEWEFARTMPGWVPRRLGGGLGGRKESGQLRFGGRDRPFRRPLILPVDNQPTIQAAIVSHKSHRHSEEHEEEFKSKSAGRNSETSKFDRLHYKEDYRRSREVFDVDHGKHYGQKYSKYSAPFYQGKSGPDMMCDFHTERNPRKRDDNRHEEYRHTQDDSRYHKSNRYHEGRIGYIQGKVNKEDSTLEIKHSRNSNRAEDDGKAHYRSSNADVDSATSSHYREGRASNLYSKVDSAYMMCRSSGKKYANISRTSFYGDMSYRNSKTKELCKVDHDSKQDFSCEVNYKEPHKRKYTRESSADSSTSQELNRQKKHKKSNKHKKKKHRKNSSNSDDDIPKKHKKKKKRKSKKKESETESD